MHEASARNSNAVNTANPTACTYDDEYIDTPIVLSSHTWTSLAAAVGDEAAQRVVLGLVVFFLEGEDPVCAAGAQASAQSDARGWRGRGASSVRGAQCSSFGGWIQLQFAGHCHVLHNKFIFISAQMMAGLTFSTKINGVICNDFRATIISLGSMMTMLIYSTGNAALQMVVDRYGYGWHAYGALFGSYAIIGCLLTLAILFVYRSNANVEMKKES